MTDYLIGTDQKIPDWLVQNATAGKVEIAMESWFTVLWTSGLGFRASFLTQGIFTSHGSGDWEVQDRSPGGSGPIEGQIPGI